MTDPALSSHRIRIRDEIVERTGIDEAMIRRLVHGFYDRVREDEMLGPVFEARISDWDMHLGRMCDFWSSVAIMSGRYQGHPMPKHMQLPVDARHFDRWIELFEATAYELCPPTAADHFVERARNIAASLEMGVASFNGVLLGKGERYTGQAGDGSGTP